MIECKGQELDMIELYVYIIGQEYDNIEQNDQSRTRQSSIGQEQDKTEKNTTRVEHDLVEKDKSLTRQSSIRQEKDKTEQKKTRAGLARVNRTRVGKDRK